MTSHTKALCLRSILLPILFVFAVMPGCNSAPRASEGARIAVVLKTLSNPYWLLVQVGIQSEAAKLGVKVDVLAANGEEDLEGQQRLVEDLCNQDYAAMGVAPITPVNLLQGVVAATRKGIYVVDIDESFDLPQLRAQGGSIVAIVGTDDVAIGQMAGEFIVQTLADKGGSVAMIEGKAGSATGDARKRGWEEALRRSPAVKIAASQPADWDRTKAVDVAANILQRNPGLKALYAANDIMALGAVQAVASANKTGSIIVVGTDGSEEALQSIGRGELTATIAQDPKTVGARALDALVEALHSKPAISPALTPKTIAVAAHLVTKSH